MTHPTRAPTRADAGLAAAIGAVLVVGALVAPAVLHTWQGMLSYAIAAIAFLVWIPRRFSHLVPYRGSPAYRLIVVAVLVLGVLLIITPAAMPFLDSVNMTPDGEAGARYQGLTRQAHFGLFALLFFASTLVLEIFFRGVVYSLLEDWKGSALAVVGSAALYAVLALPGASTTLLGAASFFFAGLVLASSRWWTSSVTPALLAQGVTAVTGAGFLVLIGLS